MNPTDLRARLTGWFATWRPVLPLFAAEFIVWIGFGALLPVLPLYFLGQGVDLATLGIVVAAWPAARLVGEPAFGWLADRTARVPLMVGGLVFSGIFLGAPLVVHGATAFVLMRALAGLATAAYDPAARGFIIDAMPAEKQGEAFGWYGSFQMSGLFVGPAIGGFGAIAFGGIGFGLVFGGITSLLAAVAVGLTVREGPRRGMVAALPGGLDDLAPDRPPLSGSAASSGRATPPTSLVNRLLIAAVILNASGNFGGGTYDVIWSPYLTALGGSPGLVGLTFSMFSIPVLVLGPIVGRLVDRRGTLGFLIVGSCMVGVASLLYTLISDAFLAVPIILLEATGFAIIWPALYAIVARGSPAGRSSTAQGVYGAFGTVGFIVASLVTGVLASGDMHRPFYLFSAVSFGFLALALFVGARSILATEPSTIGRRHLAGGGVLEAAGHLTGFVTEPAMETASGSPGGGPPMDAVGAPGSRPPGGAR
ncbi:MAG TPA: MFS transporter [Candidatus Limnocylindrales bacterium]